MPTPTQHPSHRPSPRALYANDEIDFAALALQYPDFAKKLKSPTRQLDFSDPDSVRALTYALLHRDFGLVLRLPDDRLCPPVPGRVNYVAWVQDLVDSTGEIDFTGQWEGGWDGDGDGKDGEEGEGYGYDPDRNVLGLDVGTGASCVYPLLASALRDRWRFFVTEADAVSRGWAVGNVRRNGMEGRIRFLDVERRDGLGGKGGKGGKEDGEEEWEKAILPAKQLASSGRVVDFVMTNPPFYASAAEMADSARRKKRPPHSACTGAEVEMVTRGGETGFVGRMIGESARMPLRKGVQWFSAMLGKLESVGVVVGMLRGQGCTNYAVTEFVQGTKTRRWGVAWSWWGRRPGVGVARGIPGLEKRLLPFPSEFEIGVEGIGVEEVGRRVNEAVGVLDLRWQWRQRLNVGMGVARRDVWSRKARRRRKAKEEGGSSNTNGDDGESEDEDDDQDEAEPALIFRISVRANGTDGSTVVSVRWMQGQDHVLFESFCGWLQRNFRS